MKYSSVILMQLQVVLAFLFVMMISLYDLMEINRPEQIRSKLLVRLIQLRKTVTPILIAALLELPVLYFLWPESIPVPHGLRPDLYQIFLTNLFKLSVAAADLTGLCFLLELFLEMWQTRK